ncbi:hypothetical protein RIF29_24147 [Crotalaria pallida]|uniref:Uncharacterized protein n=1 Tax=Crotalaria pallida TaxID=3830 RepID=A0AAN9EJT8_CROPI
MVVQGGTMASDGGVESVEEDAKISVVNNQGINCALVNKGSLDVHQENTVMTQRNEFSELKDNSPFGSWMMVQHTPRSKECMIVGDNISMTNKRFINKNLGSGSRFAVIVVEDMGEDAVQIDEDQVIVAPIEKEVKVVRIRNSTGGKNTQNKSNGKHGVGNNKDRGPKPISKNTHQLKHAYTSTLKPSSSVATQLTIPNEEANSRKAKLKEEEEFILQSMKSYAYRNPEAIENVISQVFHGDEQIMEHVRQRHSLLELSVRHPKPPDISNSSNANADSEMVVMECQDPEFVSDTRMGEACPSKMSGSGDQHTNFDQ